MKFTLLAAPINLSTIEWTISPMLFTKIITSSLKKTKQLNQQQKIYLQYFSCISEISNITKSINTALFLSRYHRIYISMLCNITTNNFWSCFSKSKSKKSTNFYNSIFNYSCFILVLFFVNKLLIFSWERIICNLIYLKKY